MKIFILGGAGFIGSHLARQLHQAENVVTVYDRNVNLKMLPNGISNIIEGDFLNEGGFEELLADQDIIIHLISTVSPYTSMINPTDSYKLDVIKTIELLEAAKKMNVGKVIFLSSGGTVYGDHGDAELLNEGFNCNPLNHYGIMKLTIEKIMLLYNQLFGMENIVLRVANPYGVGQDPSKKIGAVSVFLNTILQGESITLYGDGSTTRDYIDIDDVCNAIVAAVSYRASSFDILPVFNVGTGIGTSIVDIIRKIEHYTSLNANIDFKSMRSIDVKRNVLDPRRAKEYLGFKAQISIDEGIKKLVNNYLNTRE
ncbi:NAD-dependent epimerase/dehydratase family protein [Paenibacillus sp. CN-4]|uniref:NAD-dependent epimerase/dehydratase family protein n=1 Tax=Paenibacillus nanchangensis TaxID=3348343 RepID=UPI003979DD24